MRGEAALAVGLVERAYVPPQLSAEALAVLLSCACRLPIRADRLLLPPGFTCGYCDELAPALCRSVLAGARSSGRARQAAERGAREICSWRTVAFAGARSDAEVRW